MSRMFASSIRSSQKFSSTPSRRELLRAGAAVGLATVGFSGTARADGAPDGLTTTLRVGPAQARMAGDAATQTAIWAYNGRTPGPVLRVRQGMPLKVTAVNALSESTTVHWHGMRLPNAMDGVPRLTQPPISPGAHFVYQFTPPDAGTFWYHSHDDSLVQMGRGLAGALIVQEAEPPAVDRDLLWTIQDWRLLHDAQIAPDFDNHMEAAMDGRIGNTVTINGQVPGSVRVRAGERLRLRLLNAAIARIMALRFEGHRPVIVALDGQPCTPHEPADGRILLGPAMRADVMLDMQGAPAQSYRVIDDFYERATYTLVRLDYDRSAPLRRHPADTSLRLPPNPLPRPDLGSAVVHEVQLQGGMMSGMRGAGMMGSGRMGGGMMGGGAKGAGMMGGGMMGMSGTAAWSINGHAMTGDGDPTMPPLFDIARGRSCILDMQNQTAWWHPMHLHGHSFLLLDRDGTPQPNEIWGDTVLVRPRERVRVAFVADNPGAWMFHCHVMEHQVGGLMTVIRVS